MTEPYRFEKFVGAITTPPSGQPLPHNMKVGQIVVRRGAARSTIAALKVRMRKAMREGMSFSIDSNMEYFAIRRDA